MGLFSFLVGSSVIGALAGTAYTFTKKYKELTPEAPECAEGEDAENVERTYSKLDTEAAKKFLAESACRKKPCETCPYIRVCNGGCRRQNVCYLTDEYCAYQKVLDHILPVLSRM